MGPLSPILNRRHSVCLTPSTCGGCQPSRCWHIPDTPWAQGRVCTCWCHQAGIFSPVGRPDKELANLQVRRNEVCYAEFCHPPLSRGLPCCFPYFLLRVSKIQFYIHFLLRNQCRFYSEKYGGKQERNNKQSIGFPSRIALATFC